MKYYVYDIIIMEIIYPGNGNSIRQCLLNNYHSIPLMNGNTMSMINIHTFYISVYFSA